MLPEEHLTSDPTSGISTGSLPTQGANLDEAAGAVIGHYHLLQKIGEGGMGEVWLAEQKEPVRRRVALKLVKAGMNSREVIARFESERQALALMDHPAIAKVLDAGATPQGAPYFAMEYVAGIPITDYCDKHRLSTRERLELFIHVCEGVQHAHQKAIIHRDLKPSNILVVELDGRAMPKIIDFGVAKALTQKLAADQMFTRVGAILGTPEYMSPEQANSSVEDIDTRSDVYSLGIIFYELLSGAPPLDLRKLTFEEFLRKLREQDPPKPSTRVRTLDQPRSAELARHRRTEPLPLVRQLRGDLDSIALKALEKDRSRRYGSPSDFAADIGRHLRNEAVLAVPPSTVYRIRKYVRRNGLVVAAAIFIVVSLAGGLGVAAWQAHVADQRFQQVRKLAGRFIELHDDVARLPGSTAVREKMVSTALDYLDSLARSAGNDAGLLAELGAAYQKIGDAQGAPGQPNLGHTEQALESFRKSEEFFQRAAALNSAYRLPLAKNQDALAYLDFLSGHLGEARTMLEASAALLEKLSAEKPDDPEVLSLAASVATSRGDLTEYEGHSKDGLPYFRQARQFLSDRVRLQPTVEAQVQYQESMNLLGDALASNGQFDEALSQAREADLLINQLLVAEPDNPRYLRQKMTTANVEAAIYDEEGDDRMNKPAESVAAYRRYLEIAERLAAADPNNVSARLSMAIANYKMSYPLGKIDPAAAVAAAQRAISILDQDLARHPDDRLLRSRRARALRHLSYALDRDHQTVGALRAAEEAIEIETRLVAETPGDASERQQVALSQKAVGRLSGR